MTPEQIAYIRQLRADNTERRLWIALTVVILAFLLVAGAFLANHFGPPKISTDAHEPVVPTKLFRASDAAGALPDGVIDLLDQAMIAEAKGDYSNALGLFTRAEREGGHIYGLNYHLALLSYKANEMLKVLPLLDLSIADGEEVAACYSLRGTLSNQAEETSQQPNDLERATRLEPLNARFFFVWGEALRRAAKPQLALPQLQRAVERLQEPALTGVYSLKLRLTQIELGQADAWATELADKLQEASPPVEWLLTAAAVAMHRGDFAAAAATLDRVRALIGDRETARLLQDVFFKNFAREAELARFFDVPASP